MSLRDQDPQPHRADPGRTSEGVRLDDVVGYNFAVLTSPDVVAGVSARVRKAWEELEATVLQPAGDEFAAWLDAHDADAVIVRPDRYVHALTRGSDALGSATLALHQRLVASEVVPA